MGRPICFPLVNVLLNGQQHTTVANRKAEVVQQPSVNQTALNRPARTTTFSRHFPDSKLYTSPSFLLIHFFSSSRHCRFILRPYLSNHVHYKSQTIYERAGGSSGRHFANCRATPLRHVSRWPFQALGNSSFQWFIYCHCQWMSSVFLLACLPQQPFSSPQSLTDAAGGLSVLGKGYFSKPDSAVAIEFQICTLHFLKWNTVTANGVSKKEIAR